MAFVAVEWMGGTGPAAVFVHANGFAPRVYAPLLDELATRLQLRALATRALLDPGSPPPSYGWDSMGLDLASWLEMDGNTPTIAIGHSMGATALLHAAAERPSLFRALVLIEPAMFDGPSAMFFSMLPRALRLRLPPAGATLRKRDTWPDRAAFRASCMRSGIYARVDEKGMNALALGGLVDTESGVRLRFPKAWEAHFYTVPYRSGQDLKNVRVPVVALRAGPSLFLSEARWRALTKALPDAQLGTVGDATHLLPLERPAEVARRVLQGLTNLRVLSPSTQ